MSEWFTVDDPETGAIERLVIPISPKWTTDIVANGLDEFSAVLPEIPAFDSFSGHVQIVLLPTVSNDSAMRTELAILRAKARTLIEEMGIRTKEDRPLLLEATYGVDDVRPDKPHPAWLIGGVTTLLAGLVLLGTGAWAVAAEAAWAVDFGLEFGLLAFMLIAIGGFSLVFQEVPRIRRWYYF